MAETESTHPKRPSRAAIESALVQSEAEVERLRVLVHGLTEAQLAEEVFVPTVEGLVFVELLGDETWRHTVCLACGFCSFGYSMNEVCPNDGSELLRLDASLKASAQTSRIAHLVADERRLALVREVLA